MPIPSPLLQGQHQPFTLIHYTNRHREAKMRYLEAYVCGHKLPTFHQPFQWSKAQQVRYLENVWLGLGVGQLVITMHPDLPELNRLIIDGQHRLTAIHNYLENDFPVFGSYWRDLSIGDQMRFEGIPAPTVVLSQDHEVTGSALRELYERLNFTKVQQPLAEVG